MPKLTNYGETPQQRILWAAIFAQGIDGRRGLPYVLQGKPGAAKTSIVRRMFSMAGIPFEGILGSIRSPTDFLGVPIPQRRPLCPADQHLSPDGDSEFLYAHYAPAGFAVRAAAAQRYGLLFDEASAMAPSVQAAMLRVLFEGVVGELQLPPGVRMFLAMNHTQDAAGGWEIAPPLANRMGWLEWNPPNVRDFAGFLVGGCKTHVAPVVDPIEEEALVDAVWGPEFARACGDVAGFLERRPNNLLVMPSEDAAKPWPSPRTIEFAARALTMCSIYGLTGMEEAEAVGAFVGPAWYHEFFAWRKEADLPNPEDVLTGRVKFTHNPARLDRTAAVLSAVGALVIDGRGRADATDRARWCWELLGQMVSSTDPKNSAADVALPTVTALVNAKLMIGQPAAYRVLASLEPLLKASGVIVGGR